MPWFGLMTQPAGTAGRRDLRFSTDDTLTDCTPGTAFCPVHVPTCLHLFVFQHLRAGPK